MEENRDGLPHVHLRGGHTCRTTMHLTTDTRKLGTVQPQTPVKVKFQTTAQTHSAKNNVYSVSSVGLILFPIPQDGEKQDKNRRETK